MSNRTGSGRAVRALIAVFVAVYAGSSAPPASAEETNTRSATASSAIDAEVRAALQEMARFLASRERFSVVMDVSYDALQGSGTPIEINERRTVSLARPDRLRVESEGSDAQRQLLMFDGKSLSLVTQPANVYARSEVAGTIDHAIRHFLETLGMRLPLALMLSAEFPDVFDARLQAARFIESTSIFGAPAHHFAGRAAGIDFQIWIADGDTPLPQRIVLTYREDKGRPQFRAQFHDWNLDPQFAAGQFAFEPPPGGLPISFAAELARHEAITPPKP